MIRWAVSCLLYVAGDLTYRVGHPDCDVAAWLYQRLMAWSVAAQGDGPGPWKDPKR